MPLHFSNTDLIETIIRALSWTLIHSLWQGMLLALVAGSILFFTKKTSPAARYNLLTAALLVFITSIVITFCTQVTTKKAIAQRQGQTVGYGAIIEQIGAAPVAENNLPMVVRAIDFFNANAVWIVLAWLMVIVLRCARLTAGVYTVYQLKNKQVASPGEYWNKQVAVLSSRLGIHKKVRLIQSGMSKMPAVIGYFKPVILFPAGMLTSLSPAEVEAILIHELAHIRRKDFLVNLLQQVIEIIFFFNPAVKWVSSLIKIERENCCDDIAVRQTDNKRNYISALIAFEGFDLPHSQELANAFGGGKDQLVNRVKRIIYNNNKTLNNMEKKVLTAGLIITSVFIFAFSANNFQQGVVEKKYISLKNGITTVDEKITIRQTIADTIPAKDSEGSKSSTGTINNVENGKEYKIVLSHDKIAELYVNGKKIPAEKIPAYRSITEKILTQSKLDMEQSEKDMEQAQKEIEESREEQVQSEKELTEAKIEMEKQQETMEQDVQEAKENAELSESAGKEDMQLAKERLEEVKKEMAQAKQDMVQSKKAMQQAKKEMAQNMIEAKKRLEQVKRDIEYSKLDMIQSRKAMEQSRKELEESKKTQQAIVADFITENIIKNKEELSSYKLSDIELIVNGVKQPDAVHKRIKAKYVKGNNWTMAYSYNSQEEVK